MRNYRVYIACIAWLAAMIVLPSDVAILCITGTMASE